MRSGKVIMFKQYMLSLAIAIPLITSCAQKNFVLGEKISYFDLLHTDLKNYLKAFLKPLLHKELVKIDLTPTTWEDITPAHGHAFKEKKLLGAITARDGTLISSTMLDDHTKSTDIHFVNDNTIIILYHHDHSPVKIVSFNSIIDHNQKPITQEYAQSKMLCNWGLQGWRSIHLKNSTTPTEHSTIEKIIAFNRIIGNMSDAEAGRFAGSIKQHAYYPSMVKKLCIDAHSCHIAEEIVYKEKKNYLASIAYDSHQKRIILDDNDGDLYYIDTQGNKITMPHTPNENEKEGLQFKSIHVLRDGRIITNQIKADFFCNNWKLKIWEWDPSQKIYQVKPLCTQEVSSFYTNPEETQILLIKDLHRRLPTTLAAEKYPLECCILDLASGAQKLLFEDKTKSKCVSAAHFLADYKCLIGTCSFFNYDVYNRFEIWNTTTAQLIAYLNAHKREEVRSIDVSPNNSLIALSNSLWNIKGIAALDNNHSLGTIISVLGTIEEQKQKNKGKNKGTLMNQDKIDALALLQKK